LSDSQIIILPALRRKLLDQFSFDCCTLCVFVALYVYLLYYVCIAAPALDAGLLTRSQYPEEPATGHLDTGFSWFPCVYKRMLRWFPSFQVDTTCLSCSPPDLNFLVTFYSYLCKCKISLPPGDNPIAVNNNNNNYNYNYNYYYYRPS
jgi:hypothetical protein